MKSLTRAFLPWLIVLHGCGRANTKPMVTPDAITDSSLAAVVETPSNETLNRARIRIDGSFGLNDHSSGAPVVTVRILRIESNGTAVTLDAANCKPQRQDDERFRFQVTLNPVAAEGSYDVTATAAANEISRTKVEIKTTR